MEFFFKILCLLTVVSMSLELRIYFCPTPHLANGKMRLKQRSKFVRYSCNVGFILSGDRYSNCVHGKWDSPAPKCVRPGCRRVDPPSNGLIYPSHLNAVLHFYCKSGFELRGPNITHCNGTSWSANMPICLPSNSKPVLSCDFEKADLCGWTHDLNHDFDWRRMQFNTPSGAIGTGPSFDHTYGEGKAGFYMYIESSSRNENDTARLISPVYDKTDNDTCFQFYYHMYGTTIGSLRVYLKLVDKPWNFDPSKAFFEKDGNQGDRWIRYTHLFGPINDDYQIIIEGKRGSGYVSDIAIDDVRIIEDCNLEELKETEIPTTTEMEEFSTTDFLPDDVFSCENKCFSTEVMMGKHRKCACDENCFDRNECCPDFIDFCVILGGTATDSEYTSSPATLSESTTSTDKTELISEKSIQLTTEKTHEIVTTEKTHEIVTTQISHHPITYTLRIIPQTDATTEKVTTINFQEITTKRVSLTTADDNKIDESIDEIRTKINLQTTTDISNDIPQIPNDMVPIEDVAHLKRKYNEKIIILKPQEPSNISFYLSICGFILILCISATVILKKRGSFRSRGFTSSYTGDSASDVRFLTSDELLDFNVDYE